MKKTVGKHGNRGKGGQGASGGHRAHHAGMVADFRRRFWITLVLTVPVVALSSMVQGGLGVSKLLSFPHDGYVQFALATIVFFYGGWPFLTGLVDELKRHEPGMMTLIGLAVLVSYIYSGCVVFGLPGKVFFWELATLILVMLLGHWIEMRSVMGASGALEELVQLIPKEAHLIKDDGDTEDVPVTGLKAGDRVLIKPGEKIPTDGIVQAGRSSVNEAMLTGESRPVEKTEGDEAVGGAINGEASLTLEVKKVGDETYLSQVVKMVEAAQESRSGSQNLADRAAFWLTITAVTLGGTTLGFWLVFGKQFVFSLERMVTVMVITCPHALGLAVPLVVSVSTSMAASRGLLIRDRSAFERARHIDAVVFDKTGTLTQGRFGVTDVFPMTDMKPHSILRLAASLESRSEHPVARGIVAAARERGIQYADPEKFKALPGKGAMAEIDGVSVKVVSGRYLKENNLHEESAEVGKATAAGKTVVYLLVEERATGAIALTDIVRDESRNAVSRLKAMGIRVMMLTGDAEPVARWVATALELNDYFSEVLPGRKASKIAEIKDRGHTVAMVGDGINDAPALVAADVGVAIGAGTDVAMEAADIVLVRSNPEDVLSLLALSKATYSKMVQNLWWAIGYNAIAIPLAAGILYPFGFLLPPAAGALFMSISTVIVAINAKSLGKMKLL